MNALLFNDWDKKRRIDSKQQLDSAWTPRRISKLKAAENFFIPPFVPRRNWISIERELRVSTTAKLYTPCKWIMGQEEVDGECRQVHTTLWEGRWYMINVEWNHYNQFHERARNDFTKKNLIDVLQSEQWLKICVKLSSGLLLTGFFACLSLVYGVLRCHKINLFLCDD